MAPLVLKVTRFPAGSLSSRYLQCADHANVIIQSPPQVPHANFDRSFGKIRVLGRAVGSSLPGLPRTSPSVLEMRHQASQENA